MVTERQTKTPRQRAEEALAVAERKVERLIAVKAKAEEALDKVTKELNAAHLRVGYLLRNPDLPQPETDDTSAISSLPQTGMDVPEPPEVGA